MSEVGVCCFESTRSERDGKTRTVGRSMPGIDYRLVDDAGEQVPPAGTPGELILRRKGGDPPRGGPPERVFPRPRNDGPTSGGTVGFIPAIC